MTTDAGLPGTSPQDDRRFALIVAALYFVFTGFVLARHEMWFDEIQAWQLTRTAGSLGELLSSKRYEGHPDAWYLVLFPVTRIWRDPVAMQVVHLVFASAVAYVVARWAPFGRVTRALLVCGYYLAYEYAVISRGYVLGVLALFALCALCVDPSRWSARPLAAAALLALLANTSVLGLILAGAMGLALVADAIAQPSARQEVRRRPWATTIAVALALGAVAWSVYSILPPPDAEFTGHTAPAQPAEGARWRSAWRVWFSIAAVWRGYVPNTLSTLAGAVGRGTASINATVNTGLFGVILSGLAVLATLLVARRRVAAVVLFVAGAGVIVYFTYCCFIGSVRHEGHLYLLFVASAWLAMGAVTHRSRRLLDRVAAGLVTTLASVHVLLAARAVGRDLVHPFSTGRQAAAFIKERGWHTRRIVATPRPEAVVIAGFLDRPVFNPELGNEMSHAAWGTPVPFARVDRTLAVVDSLAKSDSTEILVVSAYRLPTGAGGIVMREVTRFDDSIVTSERFHIYLAQPTQRRDTLRNGPTTGRD